MTTRTQRPAPAEHRHEVDGLEHCFVDDDVLAVLAHGWLSSLGIVQMAAATLRHVGDDAPAALQDELLGIIDSEAASLAACMTQMIRGARPEVAAAR